MAKEWPSSAHQNCHYRLSSLTSMQMPPYWSCGSSLGGFSTDGAPSHPSAQSSRNLSARGLKWYFCRPLPGLETCNQIVTGTWTTGCAWLQGCRTTFFFAVCSHMKQSILPEAMKAHAACVPAQAATDFLQLGCWATKGLKAEQKQSTAFGRVFRGKGVSRYSRYSKYEGRASFQASWASSLVNPVLIADPTIPRRVAPDKMVDGPGSLMPSESRSLTCLHSLRPVHHARTC